MLLLSLVLVYNFVGKILGNKDLSDIACYKPDSCAVVSDETNMITLIKKEGTIFTVTENVVIDKEFEELDLEALASTQTGYYALGSHGNKRKSGAYAPGNHGLYYIGLDQNNKVSKVLKRNLDGLLESSSVFKDYFNRPLQQNGVNLEAMTLKDGVLYIGPRAPNLNGYIFIIKVAEANLGREVFAYALDSLYIGAGYGLREMVSLDKGFLLVAGNSLPEDAPGYRELPYVIYWWDGDLSRPNKKLRVIKNDSKKKLEGIEVLEQSDEKISVLLLYDGVENGAMEKMDLHLNY